MATEKTKYRVLVASAGDKTCEFISDILPPADYEPILRAHDAGEARRMLLEQEVDIMVINAPLSDEPGVELAIDYAETSMGIMLLVRSEIYEHVAYRMEEHGVLTVTKPNSKQAVYAALRLLTAVSARLRRMEKKNRSLEKKMTDIRVVDRAKWLLIEHLKMTEDDAHYFIEKQAMDARLSRREVAENIIRTYDE